MSHKENASIMLDALEAIKKKKAGQYHENVIDFCADEYGLTVAETEAAIEAAKAQSLIKEGKATNQKVAYRKMCSNVAKMNQINKPEIVGSIESDSDDLVDFKRFIHSEILAIKEQVAHNKQSSIYEPDSGQQPDNKLLIKSLQDRIISLEKQLQQKQWIIEKLLDRPKENVNKSEQQPQKPKYTPMGEDVSHSTRSITTGSNLIQTAPEHNKGQKGELLSGNKALSTNNQSSNGPAANNKTISKRSRKNKKRREKLKVPTASKKVEPVTNIAEANATDSNTNAINSKHNESGVWKKDTVLIVGDSMLFNINENTLSRRYHTKVRSFPGSTVVDLHDYIKPLLRKQPDKIILVIGTNDIAHESVSDILKRIKSLVNFIQEEVPQCHVVVSEIIRRGKDSNLNGKINKFNQDLKSMNVDILRQQNLLFEHIGRCRLHLNAYGDTQLARTL